MGKKDHDGVLFVLVIVITLAVSFFCTAFLFWLACYAFGWEWTWKASLGVWAVIVLIKDIFKRSGKNG